MLLFIIILMYKQESNTIKYLILYTILALSTFYQFDLIRRFMYLVPLFMIEPLFILLSEKKINNYFEFKKFKIKTNTYFIYNYVIFVNCFYISDICKYHSIWLVLDILGEAFNEKENII